jgi:hypothetical protein
LPILLATAAALVAACGGSSSPNTPTPTPLTTAQIQARYTAAADRYNTGEQQIATAENSECTAGSTKVSLKLCQTTLSEARQLTITYDNGLRAIPFSGNAATEEGRLLGDDAAIEKLLEQAATAPSISVITTLQAQIIPLLATAATDATALRSAIDLPPPD